ncbi:MAG: glycosyltransferase family 2 protein [Arenimonas sp.]
MEERISKSRISFQGKLVGAGRPHAATDIGVVVVSFQSERTIVRCLDLLLVSPAVVRIVVVDNASVDGTMALLKLMATTNPRISVVRDEDNRGFAAACNQGASALSTPWVAFVNPDCFVRGDSLPRLVQHGLERVGAGLLGCNMIDEFGQSDPAARRRDPSLRELLGRGGGRDDLYLGRDPRQDLQAVEAVSGALMLMPLGLFLQLAGFDENFHLHVEDLDLCRRTRKAGYEVLCANDITVVHVGGVSSRSRPVWVEWQKHTSLWRYFRKFERSETAFALVPLLWLGLWAHFLLASVRALVRAASAPPIQR